MALEGSSRKVTEVAHQSDEWRACVDLRNEVLRRPLGLSFTSAELEREASDLHIACHDDGRLTGCLVLVPMTEGWVKMRQVAVTPAAQGQGVGRAMTEFAEALARQRGLTRMTLHARETAIGFYERLGYAQVGGIFEEVTIPHVEMQKAL